VLSRAFGNAVISLMLSEPFYAHVISELQLVASASVPVAGVTPDIPVKLLINIDAFDRLAPVHRVGVLKHEVLHMVMEHFMRRDSRDPELFNVAADLAVNELIDKSQLPPDVVTVSSLLSRFGITLPSRAAAEVYYDILCRSGFSVQPKYDLSSQVSSGVRIYHGDKSTDYAQPGAPGSTGYSADTTVPGELARELICQLIDRAVKTCGKLPAGLEEYISTMQQVKVNWRRILARFLLGRGRTVALPTYTREHRRYDDYPGRRKKVGLEALVAIDTSGSMSSEQLSDILAHLLQIKKISGTRIWVTWGDTKCEGGPLPIEKVGSGIKLKGRGGTDLCWPFGVADRMRVPLLVYFTDGYGPAPQQAQQKVVWVLTRNGRKPADYGFVLKLD